MSVLVPLVFLTGVLLGLRFRIFILAPAFGFAIVVVVATGTVRGEDPFSILLAALLALVSLQIGYVGGILTRYAFTLARAEIRRKASLRVESVR